MLLLAWGLGWWVARRRARSTGIATWHVDGLVPVFLVGSAMGTWLVAQFSQHLAGGTGNDRVLYGALWMAVGVGAVYGWMARLPLGRLGDTFALSLPLGISVLRIGCFCAGCCWGDICGCAERVATVDDPAWRRQVQTMPDLCREDWPLCVRFPEGSPAFYQHLTAGLLEPHARRSLPVHPVQLYEAAGSLALLGILLLVDRRLRRWGDAFCLSVFGYCALRFAVEWFRADNVLLTGGLTLSQVISILSGFLCLALWAARVILAKGKPDGYNRSIVGFHAEQTAFDVD